MEKRRKYERKLGMWPGNITFPATFMYRESKFMKTWEVTVCWEEPHWCSRTYTVSGWDDHFQAVLHCLFVFEDIPIEGQGIPRFFRCEDLGP